MALPKRPTMNRPQRAPESSRLQRSLPKRTPLPQSRPEEDIWEEGDEETPQAEDDSFGFGEPEEEFTFGNDFTDNDFTDNDFTEDDEPTQEFSAIAPPREEPVRLPSRTLPIPGRTRVEEPEEEETFQEFDFESSGDSFGVEPVDEIMEQEPTGDFDYNEFGLAPMDHDDYVETETNPQEDVIVILQSAIQEFPSELHPAIESFLALLDNDEVSEIVMNSPDQIGYKRAGSRLIKQADFLNVETYHQFINEILLPLTDTEERIEGDNYLIEGQLTFPSTTPGEAPVVGRTHIVTPPVVNAAKVTIAKKARVQFTLDDMYQSGSMSKNMMNFLKAISHGKATTVISGVSGAGKTTLIEAMSYHFDSDDRIIIVEDTPELRIPAGDVVSLTAKSARPGMDEKDVVSMEWLVKATNRMRPDRILVGECRGGEFAEFLIAANSGADGSMTTIHASNPRLALDKMVSLAMKSATAKNESSVIRDINSTVQIIVQADIVDGKHVISRIEEISSMQNSTGKINSATLFEYERHTQRFIARHQPSDELRSFLEQHGVDIPAVWFR